MMVKKPNLIPFFPIGKAKETYLSIDFTTTTVPKQRFTVYNDFMELGKGNIHFFYLCSSLISVFRKFELWGGFCPSVLHCSDKHKYKNVIFSI